MSLRLRLFLLVAGLVALVLGCQWWMTRRLSRDVAAEAQVLAFAIGDAVVKQMQEAGAGKLEHESLEASGEPPPAPRKLEVRVFEHREKPAAGDTAQEVRRVVVLDPGEPQAGLPDELRKTIDEAKARLQTELETGADEPYLLVSDTRTVRRIPIPSAPLESRMAEFSRRLLLGTFGLAILGLVLAAGLAHHVSSPLRELAGAARRIGEGRFGSRVESAAGGEVGQALAAFNQMSERLAELDEDARRLREGRQLSELGEVSRGLAHSLRNPLNALGLSLETLAESELPLASRRELAGTARAQIQRIDRSLRSFLALAASGGVAEQVDVAALIRDVALEALQDGAGKVRVSAEPATDLPPLAAVAPELRAVLQALVINAVEASPPGGQVTIRAQPLAPGRVQIEVDDDGPGLAPEVRERLFTPHLSTKAQGSGMGLFLAHRIAVHRYDGRLALEDRQPRGTSARLELGARRQEEPDDA